MSINIGIKHRRDTAANWTASNTILLEGQIGFETDTFTLDGGFRYYKVKFGDGSTAWNDLPYMRIAGLGGGAANLVDLGDTPANYAGAGSMYLKVNSGATGVEFTIIAASDLPTGIDAAKLADGTVSNAEFQYIGGLTSDAQDQFDAITTNITGIETEIDNLTTAEVEPSTDRNYVTDAQQTVIVNTSGTNSGDEDATSIGVITTGATAKTTPVDADTMPLNDSAAANALKKVTWANIKATLTTAFNSVYAAVSHTHAASDVTSGTLDGDRLPAISTTKTGGAPATGTPTGKFLKDDGTWDSPSGSGDMLAATYDPQSIAGDTFDTDNHTDGTTNKVFSATEQTKLTGIETSADVTDAANVGSSVHGATAKSSLVNGDKVAIIDSEAGNVLKTSLWSVIVSTLTTAFNSVYAAISHAHAGTDITSGTIDGDRLPAMSSSKQGAVPATGTPAGLYLKDDGTWAASSAALTVGSSAITSGTDTLVLYDNAGTLAESALLGVNTSLARVVLASGWASADAFHHYEFRSRSGNSKIYLDGGAWYGYDAYGLAAFGLLAADSANKYFWTGYGQQHAISNLNAATLTLTLSHHILSVDYTVTGTVAITLPSASTAYITTFTNKGQVYYIYDSGANAGANNITINRAGSDTIITDATGQTSAVINTDGGGLILQAISATEWKATAIGGGGSGATAFTGLSDVPATYSGQSNKYVKVNVGETALEFVTLSGGGDMLAATYDAATVNEQLVGLTATQTLTNKTLTAPVVNSPTGIVKGDVGLGNVDNTSDATLIAAITALVNLVSIQGHTVTLTGAFIRSGAHSLTLTTSGTTNVTLPTSGTLITTGVTSLASLVTIQGHTVTLTGNFIRVGAHSLTITTTATTSVTFPTSGTLINSAVTSLASLVTIQGFTFTLTGNFIRSGAHSLTLTTTATTNATIPSGTVTLVGTAATQTLTNKRVTPRTGTTTSSATPTINTDNVDYYSITALAVNITSMTTNLSGTPTTKQLLRIDITGTAARAITWGASFANGPVALPTTTVTTTRLYVGLEYDGTIWRCMASGPQV